MNPEQIPELIAKIALADPRVRRDDKLERRAQAEMWAGILADVPADFALQAAHEHYRRSSWPILPADIATRWSAAAKDRLARHTDPKPAIDPDHVTDWCRELAATRRAVASGHARPAPYAIAAARPIAAAELVAGIGHLPPSRNHERPYMPEHARTALTAAGLGHHPPEQDIRCPVSTCRAQPRQPCTAPSGRRLRDSHPSRLDAWILQQAAA